MHLPRTLEGGREEGRKGGREGGRNGRREGERKIGCNSHPLFINERVDLGHRDDLGHETAEPFRVQKEELSQLALDIRVVEQNTTLMEEADRLKEDTSNIASQEHT